MIDVQAAINQLYPGLSTDECAAWLRWVRQQPHYHVCEIRSAGCIAKVFDQEDPPWSRVAMEVAWWGHGRDAVRALHRAIDWARLQGATMFAYSTCGNLCLTKWRKL